MLVLQEQYASQQIESKCIYNLPPEFDPVFLYLATSFILEVIIIITSNHMS
jgi:hypothetical protein